MSEWRVDPDGVLGVLAGLDDQGPDFESANAQFTDAWLSGSRVLTRDGRTELAAAWEQLMELRRLVPGKIISEISRAAGAISEATLAITLGDVEMAENVTARQTQVEDLWGIAPRDAYWTEGRYL